MIPGDLLAEGDFNAGENTYEDDKRIFASRIGLANFVQIFNFPLYLLSGGVLAAWDLFAPSMFAEMRLRSLTFRNTDTKVEKATLGSDAGLYGAAYLPFQSAV